MSLSIVFPGQGSQSLGMLKDIAPEFPEILQIFEDASDILGYDLWKCTQAGPASELDKTEVTQPALLVAAYAIWQILKNNSDLAPAYLAGHSLGEYTALLCADVISFTDAVRIVQARGRFMQDAVPAGQGAMAAIIGLEHLAVSELCERAANESPVSCANYNSPGQVVIAGEKLAVEKVVAMAKEEGAKMAVLLPVSVPSHCSLMLPAAERLKEMLAEVSFHTPAKISIINNIYARPYTDAESIRQGLIQQLHQPVQWVGIIEYFIQHQVTEIIECGPGKILTGLNKRIDKSLQLSSTQDFNSLSQLLNNKKARSA